MADVGRPSKYDADMAASICERLANGESLRAICADDAMPDKSTVLRWLANEEHASFRDQYARAREMQADHLAEDILEISDDARNDWMERNHGEADPGWVANGEHIQRSRLRVDSRKWLASKLAPKKYGDKVTHAGDADNPLQLVPIINVTVGGSGPSSSSEAG